MKKELGTYSVIGVIGLALVAFWFASETDYEAAQYETSTGAMSTWSDVQIKELRQKQADSDVKLMEAKRQKTELLEQIATIDAVIEKTRQARRDLDNQVTGLINGNLQTVIYQSTWEATSWLLPTTP